MARGPFRRRADGSVEVHLRLEERALLATLPLQLRELLDTDEPSLRRLFPVAYHQDPKLDAEFQRLMRQDLLDRRIGAAEKLAATAEEKVLDPAMIDVWLGAINDLRLVLGTQLDVSEGRDEMAIVDALDEDDPRIAQYEVYGWLGFLMEMLIRASTSPEDEAAPSFFDSFPVDADGEIAFDAIAEDGGPTDPAG